MADDPLAPLVREWQAARAHGLDLTPEELCKDCPELLPRLTARLAELRGTGPLRPPLDPFGTLGSANVPAGYPPTPPAPESADKPPRRVGNYKLLEVLGEGGMGVVYRATEEHLDRQVALKLIHPEKVFNPRVRERFLKEAKAQAGIDHENVVPIYAAGEQDGQLFLAMPLLRGETLKDYLDREPRPPVGFLVKVGTEVADGLAAAHARGVIHRDVKPSNVWLEGDPAAPAPADRVRRCKLLDFGLARQTNPGAGLLTGTQEMLGTPAYMSPEQLEGGRAVDPRTDLFSLGVMLYEMATGRHPFHDKTSIANTFVNVATLDPPFVTKANPQVPDDLAELIGRMMTKDAADRPASAKEVGDRLRAIAQRPDVPVSPPPPAAPSSGRTVADKKTQIAPVRRKRRLGPVVAIGLAAVGLIAAVAYMLSPGPNPVTTDPTKPTVTTDPTKKQSDQAGTQPTPHGSGVANTQSTQKKEPPPPPPPVDVRIRSTPDGATVAEVGPDGNFISTDKQTPAVLTLPPGKHTRALIKDGYETARVAIDTATPDYDVTLRKIPPPPPETMRLVVRGLPAGAKVTFPDDATAKAIDAAAGAYEVRRKPQQVKIEASGFETATRAVSPPGDAGTQMVEVDGSLKRAALATEITNAIGMPLRLIPAGRFRMGIEGKAEKPLDDQVPRDVEITRPFYLGATEVTVGQFRQFLTETRGKSEAEQSGTGGFGYDKSMIPPFAQRKEFTWANPGFKQGDDHPVVNVTWNDAKAFCAWLSKKDGRPYRLPSEAEWEYAARANGTGLYPFGDSAGTALRGAANLGDRSLAERFAADIPRLRYDDVLLFDDGHPFTAPVKSYKPNGFGLYDMFGNAVELCEDWYGVLPNLPVKDPVRREAASPGIKVARGGSFLSNNTPSVATRYQQPIDAPFIEIGFRVVADAGEQK